MSNPENTVRVVVADQNDQVRVAVVELLTPDFEVIGTASDGAAAYEMVRVLTPDILVLDITLPGISGLETAAKLKIEEVKVKIVFLTVHRDPDYVTAALGVGAFGYVVKSQMATELSVALRSALKGNVFISPSVTMSGRSMPPA